MIETQSWYEHSWSTDLCGIKNLHIFLAKMRFQCRQEDKRGSGYKYIKKGVLDFFKELFFPARYIGNET